LNLPLSEIDGGKVIKLFMAAVFAVVVEDEL